MRFVRNLAFLSVLSLGSLGHEARADIIFSTQSTATQEIYSPPLGGSFSLSASGPQTFDLNLAAGTATVTSAFTGTDFPDPLNPGSFLNYDLYNTTTTGTVTQVGSMYNVNFSVLFELQLTSGPLAGFTFQTESYATFDAANIPSTPFPVGTSFSDPNAPNDSVPIYVKYDPSNTYPVGTEAGVSFNRAVTVVPEPSSLSLTAAAGLAALAGLGFAWRRRRQVA